MTFLKMLAPITILLLLANPCFSSNEEAISRELHRQTLFNQTVLTLDRDSSVFLYSLSVLKKECAGEEVVNFMEYKLDEIVCAADKFMNKMNPLQQKIAVRFLNEIKEYRAKHPRQEGSQIDPTKFSEYFEPFNKTFARRADKILGSLN